MHTSHVNDGGIEQVQQKCIEQETVQLGFIRTNDSIQYKSSLRNWMKREAGSAASISLITLNRCQKHKIGADCEDEGTDH